MSLIPVWHHTKLLHYYSPYSLGCAWNPQGCFPTWKFVLLSLSLFHLSPPAPSSLVTIHLLFASMTLCLLFVHLFCSSDSTYKWNQTVFVFLGLVSLSIIPLATSMLLQVMWFILFYGRVMFCHIYAPRLCPFVYWWTPRLLLCLGCCTWDLIDLDIPSLRGVLEIQKRCQMGF